MPAEIWNSTVITGKHRLQGALRWGPQDTIARTTRTKCCTHFVKSTQTLFLLHSVLSEDATQTQHFEALASTLHHYFNKQDYFKVGTALVCETRRGLGVLIPAVPDTFGDFEKSVALADLLKVS